MIHTLTDNELAFYMIFAYIIGCLFGMVFCWILVRKAQEK